MSQSNLPGSSIDARNNLELQKAVLAQIQEIQSNDPLATVTLIVANRQLSWALRRQLARLLDTEQALVNVRALTPREFLNECARAYSLPTGIATEPVVRTAVIESALQSDQSLGVSAQHPETASRLARLLTELEWCSLTPEKLSSITGVASPTASAAIKFVSKARFGIQEQLHELDSVTLSRSIVRAAQEASVAPPIVNAFGSLILVNQDLPSPVRNVMQAIRATVTHIDIASPIEQSPASNTTVHSTPDPESESIIAARFVTEALAKGIPADRIAVVHSVDQPYAGLLQRALDEARITWHGAEPGSLRESVLTRRAYSLLEMATELSQALGLRRPSLMKWLALNPHKSLDTQASPSQLRNLIRSEGLFGDAQSWTNALEEISSQAKELKLSDVDELDSKTRRRIKLGPAADTMMETIRELVSQLNAINSARNWTDISTTFAATFDRYSPESKRATSPLDSTVRNLINSLSKDSLPLIDSLLIDTRSEHLRPTASTLQALLEKEIDSRSASHGDQAIGIHVGSVTSTRCLTFDRVIFVGAADGLLPSIRHSNPLFTDPVRLLLRESPADAPTLAETEREISSLIRALVDSNTNTTVLYPRGAVPSGGVPKPSRYFAHTESTDTQVNFAFPSFASSFTLGPLPVTERDLAVREGMESLQESPEFLARRDALLAWARPSFNGYFGNVGEQVLAWKISDKPLSASTIEKYIYCPYHFFVEKVLGFSTDTFDDESDEITQRDIGLMLHSALENLVKAATRENWLPAPGEEWPESALDRLTALFQMEASRATDIGLTGWAPIWAEKRAEVVDSLPGFLQKDIELRSNPDMSPGIPEFMFGESDNTRVSVVTSYDSKVELRGSIDRLDLSSDGSVAHVIDYKSGNPVNFKTGLAIKTGGLFREKIQDLVYSAAVDSLFPDVTQTKVSFVFVPGKDGIVVHTPNFDSEPSEELASIVDHMETAANSGSFPPLIKGGKSHCPVCNQLGRRAKRVTADYRKVDIKDLATGNGGDD